MQNCTNNRLHHTLCFMRWWNRQPNWPTMSLREARDLVKRNWHE